MSMPQEAPIEFLGGGANVVQPRLVTDLLSDTESDDDDYSSKTPPNSSAPLATVVSPVRVPNTPGRGNAHRNAPTANPGTPVYAPAITPVRPGGVPPRAQHPHHAELTPIIRNSNYIVSDGGDDRPLPQRRSPFPKPRDALLVPRVQRSIRNGGAGGLFGGPSLPPPTSRGTTLLAVAPPPPLQEVPCFELEPAKATQGRESQQHPPAPVALTPDRRHCSFSGVSNYKRSVSTPIDGTVDGQHPGSPFSPPARRHRPPPSPAGGPSAASAKATAARQYHPPEREAHGVKDMADKGDLDAIFKATNGAQKKKTPTNENVPNERDDHDGEASPPTVTKIDRRAFGNHEGGGGPDPDLRRPIPIEERDWSMPSLHLAKNLDSSNHSLRDFFRLNSGNSSCGNGPGLWRAVYDDDVTDEDTLSYDDSYLCADGEPLDDNDNASLGSKDGGNRAADYRRGFMREVLRNNDAQEGAKIIPNAAYSSPSLLEETLGRASIGNNQNRDEENGNWSRNGAASPPFANLAYIARKERSDAGEIDAASSGNVARHPRPSRGNKGAETSMSSSAPLRSAMLWISDLQADQHRAFASDDDDCSRPMIIEAASSKFLTKEDSKREQGDDDHALGMPHPLCRSTTVNGRCDARRP